MESFFLSETLKYLYLLFERDNFVNRGSYIFSTEGHLFPMKAEWGIGSLKPVSLIQCWNNEELRAPPAVFSNNSSPLPSTPIPPFSRFGTLDSATRLRARAARQRSLLQNQTVPPGLFSSAASSDAPGVGTVNLLHTLAQQQQQQQQQTQLTLDGLQTYVFNVLTLNRPHALRLELSTPLKRSAVTKLDIVRLEFASGDSTAAEKISPNDLKAKIHHFLFDECAVQTQQSEQHAEERHITFELSFTTTASVDSIRIGHALDSRSTRQVSKRLKRLIRRWTLKRP